MSTYLRGSPYLAICLATVGLTFPPLSAEEADMQAWLETVKREIRSQASSETDAAGAVNGKRSGRYEMHTGQDLDPWWQVDLGCVSPISSVVIHCPHCPERTAGLRVRLSSDGTDWTDVARVAGDRARVDLSLPEATGRFVRLQAKGRTWMHLDEVEVYGDDPKQNLALHHPAQQSSVSNWSTESFRQSADPRCFGGGTRQADHQ